MVVDECPATTLNVKSDRRNADSRITNAIVISPASAYTDRRPESIHSRRPVRAPYSDAPAPYSATSRPMINSARPVSAISLPGHQYDELAAWYLEGHLVVSEFCSPTNVEVEVEPCSLTVTSTPRPSANGSGTMPV